MTQNSLVPADIQKQALAKNESFDAMVSGGDYLARFQLFGSKSDACAEGKIGIGHYGLVKDDKITDIGQEVDVLVVAYRPKAVQTTDVFIVDYHPDIVDGEITNPTFKRIKDASTVKDSGCMYGPEFLLWVPSVQQFATYHMNSKTSRRESRNMEPLIGGAATMKSKLIEAGRYKWHGPVVVACTGGLDPLPTDEQLRMEFEKFNNPPRNVIETVDETEERAR